MLKSTHAMLTLSLLAIAISGCGGSEEATNPAASGPQPDDRYTAATEPTGAQGVGEVRSSAQDNDEVVVVGRIGGSVKPFAEGLAAFTIVDEQVPYCADDEGCPTPWDYCCTQDQVKENIASVRVVDAQGNVVDQDARKLLGVKELSTVVVTGKAQRNEQGNLTILATKVYKKS